MIADYSISCGVMSLPSFVLRDEPNEKYQINLEDYFTLTYKTLFIRLKRFADLSRTPDVAEEKELIPLLETLINTKEMIRLKKKIKEESS